MVKQKKKNELEIIEGKEGKLLLKYMTASVASMVGLSIYILFDTMFIGRRFGELGLASLNIAIPIFNFLYAIGLAVGVGGSTIFAIALGAKKIKKAREAFTAALVVGLIFVVITNILGFYYLKDICYWLGASKSTFPMVYSYLKVIFTFNFAFVFMNALNVFVRADGEPRLSMYSILAASVTNIVLDYIFLYPLNLGFKGAAIATVVGQIVGIIILFEHLLKKKSKLKLSFGINLSLGIKIFKNGMPSFIGEFSAGIIILAFNIILFNLEGNIALSAYGIIANIALVILAVINGIAQGMQPLVSMNFGAKKEERVKKFLKLSLIVALLFGIITYIVTITFSKELVNVFIKNNDLVHKIAANGMEIYFIAFIFMAINIIYISYLQAKELAKKAFVLSTLRGIIFILLGLYILPKIFGIDGVWLTVPIAEILVLIITILSKVKKG